MDKSVEWHITEYMRASWELAQNAKTRIDLFYTPEVFENFPRKTDRVAYERVKGQRTHLGSAYKRINDKVPACKELLREFEINFKYPEYPNGLLGRMMMVPDGVDIEAIRSSTKEIEPPYTKEALVKNHEIFAEEIILAHSRLKWHMIYLEDMLTQDNKNLILSALKIMESTSDDLALSRLCLGENYCSTVLFIDNEKYNTQQQDSMRNKYVSLELSASDGRFACVDPNKVN
jgi:hypothetical protein